MHADRKKEPPIGRRLLILIIGKFAGKKREVTMAAGLTHAIPPIYTAARFCVAFIPFHCFE
jgi:hypothetical protein